MLIIYSRDSKIEIPFKLSTYHYDLYIWKICFFNVSKRTAVLVALMDFGCCQFSSDLLFKKYKHFSYFSPFLFQLV